jgi:hypothetical protein
MKVRRFSQKNGSFWPNWPIGRPIRPICQFSPIGTFCPIGGQFANWQVRKSDDLAGLFGGLSYLANWPIGRRSYCDSLLSGPGRLGIFISAQSGAPTRPPIQLDSTTNFVVSIARKLCAGGGTVFFLVIISTLIASGFMSIIKTLNWPSSEKMDIFSNFDLGREASLRAFSFATQRQYLRD